MFISLKKVKQKQKEKQQRQRRRGKQQYKKPSKQKHRKCIVCLSEKPLACLIICVFLLEFLRDETCAALNRELMAFNLTEEDHCETRGQCADDSRTDLKSRSGSSAEEKILLQHHTVLDRHMVSAKDALFQA